MSHQGYKVPDDGYSRGAPLPTPVEALETAWRWADWQSARQLGPWTVRETDHTDLVSGEPVTLAYNGRPQGYSEQEPDAKALPRRETRITRSRKGRTSYRATSAHPIAPAPFGSTDGLPLVPCHNPAHHHACDCAIVGRLPLAGDSDGLTVLNEATLATLAEQFVAEHDPDGPPLPRIVGFSVTRPETLPGDRSTAGDTVVLDDGWRNPKTGRVAPSEARMCAVSHDDLASWFGIDPDSFLAWYRDAPGRSNDTSIADRHRTRSIIARRGRLGVRDRKRHDIAVLGVTLDARGRKRQLLGRRTATATELVTFADDGWFVGHAFMPSDAVRKARAEARRAAALASAEAKVATVAATTIAPADAPADNRTTVSKALDLAQQMPIGATLGDVTRVTQGRWQRNGIDIRNPAQAARAILATI